MVSSQNTHTSNIFQIEQMIFHSYIYNEYIYNKINDQSPERTSDEFIGMIYQTPGIVPTQMELYVRALNSLHN